MKRSTNLDAFLLILAITTLILAFTGCYKPYARGNADWKTASAVCVECHSKDANFKVSVLEKHSEINCLECHELSSTHTQSQSAEFDGIYENVKILEDRCLLCHPTDEYSNPGHWNHLGINAKLDENPIRCIDCHTDGHSLKPTDDCSKCHSDVVSNAQSMAVGHCTICHGFSRTTLEGADRSMHPYKAGVCDQCHQLDTQSTDPKSFAKVLADPHIHNTNCVICHNPHKPKDSSAGNSCLKCHKKENLDKSSTHTNPAHAAVPCQSCHKPHAFKLSGGSDCSVCHSEGMKSLPKSTITAHQDCAVCHLNGDFSKANPGSCNTCHKKELNLLSKAPKGHGTCATCHKPHKWDNPSSGVCKACHDTIFNETKVASKKKCSLCHDAHSASKSVIPDSCAKCHSKQNKACKDSPIKSDCSLCHASHEWLASWDSCATCHADMKSGQHPKHVDFGCASCHANHNWKPTDRAICLACHPDYEEHMDSSMLCTDCHWN